jgi:hypothetical protein
MDFYGLNGKVRETAQRATDTGFSGKPVWLSGGGGI